MSKSSSTTTSGGIGLSGAVFIVFLVLKLTGHINWSWWWITAPLWGSLAIVIMVLLVAFVWLLISDKD
jgi:membrane protein YdbS with pleckstrin-like domain